MITVYRHQIVKRDGTSEYVDAETWSIDAGTLRLVGIPGTTSIHDFIREFPQGEWTSIYREDAPNYKEQEIK